MPVTRIDCALDVYQVKAKLEGAPKPIWRRILIPAVMNLAEVHWVLVDAFGWPGQHVYQFQVGEKRYALPEWRVDELLSGPVPLPAAKARLYSVAPEVGCAMTWDYHFDEAWTHTVTVEKIRPMKLGDVLPLVVDGKMPAPPVGCGGMLSYRDMFAALSDPAHPEREWWMRRTRGKFDVRAFSVAECNERLSGQQYRWDGDPA